MSAGGGSGTQRLKLAIHRSCLLMSSGHGRAQPAVAWGLTGEHSSPT